MEKKREELSGIIFDHHTNSLYTEIARAKALIKKHENASLNIKKILSDPQRSSSKLTRKRLKLLLEGHQKQEKYLEKIFSPLFSLAEVEQVIKKVYQLEEHEKHLFKTGPLEIFHRDYGYGSAEIQAQFNFLCLSLEERAQGKAGAIKNMAVLGTGGSHLSLILGKYLAPEKLVLVDKDLMILWTLKTLVDRKNLQLVEFPYNPLAIEDVCLDQNLELDQRVSEFFEEKKEIISFLCADGTGPIFEKGSIDFLFCPWFVDITGESLPVLFMRFSTFLSLNGELLLFGPLGFFYEDEEFNYSFEELQSLGESFGFSLISQRSEDQNYLCSAHSAFKRKERVFSFLFKKEREYDSSIFPPKTIPQIRRGEPSPLPLLKNGKYLCAYHEIYAWIFREIDGVKKFSDLQEAFEKKFAINIGEGEKALLSILEKIYKENA